MADKPLSAVVCCFKVSFYDQMEEKSADRLTVTILEDCRLENIECSKYQLIFVAVERVLSKPFLS